jgi:peptidylprolyl isomerase domain and WD repeat-containing protein 1
MSDSEQDTSVLGKRLRHGDNNTFEGPEDQNTEDRPVPQDQTMDDSDDDVGPMPLSDNGANGGMQKRRKGQPYS